MAPRRGGRKRAMQRHDLEAEELYRATSKSLPCVDSDTSTTHCSPSECTISETSSTTFDAECKLPISTQIPPDLMLLLDDNVPLERSEASSGLSVCLHRIDNRDAFLSSETIQLKRGSDEESAIRGSSPTHLTGAPLWACRVAEHGTLLDDDRRLSPIWVHEDENSSDDEVWSVDSGVDGPSPCRRSAYDLGYSHDVRLPTSWRRCSTTGSAALRLLLFK
eukprot:TRINITY_DN3682_c0_g1_i1.p1 TRINITY_DN3682_c0_g1~~TRINITY_DN3682_c0_g1_i1.p1  ORF type:complete len:227 (-),score=20.07 TRINITY_DN3682_c0_g1_i1:266-925(-)